MSSRANKIAKTLADSVPNNTFVVPFKVNFVLDGTNKYSIVTVSGVPEGVDPDDPTVKHAAEQQFVNALNSRMYLETYSPNQDHRNDYPMFRNLMKADTVEVISVERIE